MQVTTEAPPGIPIQRAQDHAAEILKGLDAAAVPHRHTIKSEEHDEGHSAVYKDNPSGRVEVKRKGESSKPSQPTRSSSKSASHPQNGRIPSMVSFVTARETVPGSSLTPHTSQASIPQQPPQADGQLEVLVDKIRGKAPPRQEVRRHQRPCCLQNQWKGLFQNPKGPILTASSVR